MRRKVEQMETLTARIFVCASEHPESISQTDRLFKYYFPSVLKLLKVYEDVEKQPVQGENIRKTKKEIEDLIAKTIRQIGHEKDMQDIETLRSFTANMKRKDGIRKFLIPITSIAAVFVLVFSLNIYHNNRIMNNMFVTYYTPLEYDQELASRGSESISPGIISAMDAYHKKLYKDALQKFNVMQSVDRNFLIYKAICLIETKQLPEAIDLLKH